MKIKLIARAIELRNRDFTGQTISPLTHPFIQNNSTVLALVLLLNVTSCCFIVSLQNLVEMGSLKGETLALREKRETVTIHWKQDSWGGIGGDKSQTYVLCEYATRNGYSIPIYIQEGYEIKQNFTIDFRFQYGLQDNVMFFVFHDKSQKPYQQRFRCDGLQKFVYAANEVLKLTGVDISWIAGEYLKDV